MGKWSRIDGFSVILLSSVFLLFLQRLSIANGLWIKWAYKTDSYNITLV